MGGIKNADQINSVKNIETRTRDESMKCRKCGGPLPRMTRFEECRKCRETECTKCGKRFVPTAARKFCSECNTKAAYARYRARSRGDLIGATGFEC